MLNRYFPTLTTLKLIKIFRVNDGERTPVVKS